MKRRGFTLIELMVTMIIISILAGATMFALSSARESAKITKTQRTVSRLHYILAEHLDRLRVQRLPVSMKAYMTSHSDWYPISVLPGGANDYPVQAARARANISHDMMRMNLPDRYTDITDGSLSLIPRTRLSMRYERIKNNNPKVTTEHAAAECLYMIISAIPEAMDQFHDSEIGDVDHDGMPEFIDAWGNPIRFIRWPAGYLPPEAETVLQDGKKADEFDRMNTLGGYMTYPLIYSAGPDGIYDINRGVDVLGYTMGYAVETDGTGNILTVKQDSQGNLIGAPLDGTTLDGQPPNGALNHYDNITNHSRGP
jgi:prepilin-type N-terminal cleavage/methylation domain-containing protein